jgi:putative peptidoglycan lipid II flippase
MAVGTLVSRLVGFARSILLVALIGGTSAAVGGQAFAVANELPTNVYNLLAGGILGAVLVPEIVRGSRGGRHERESLDRLLTVTLLGGLVLTALLVFAAPVLVKLFALAWPPSWLQLATLMAYWCVPQVFFFILFTVLGQVLNAHHVYGPYAWAPAVSNVVAVFGLLVFLGAFPGPNGDPTDWTPQMVAVLCGTATLGVVAQSAMLVGALRRIQFRFRFRLGLSGLRGPGRIAGLAFAGVVAGQVAYVFVSNVANFAGERLHSAGIDGASLNSLSNAYLLMLVPHGIFAVSIATALFTRMSHDAVSGDIARVRTDTWRSCNQIAYVSLLVTAVFVTTGPRISQVLWGTPIIGEVLALLTIGLVGFSQMYAINRTALAVGDGRSILYTQALVASLTALGALVSAALPITIIVPGIALSTAIANLAGWALAAILLRRRFTGIAASLAETSPVRTQLPLFAAALVAIAITFATTNWWALPIDGWIGQVCQLALTAVVATASYSSVSWLLGDRHLAAIVGATQRRNAD